MQYGGMFVQCYNVVVWNISIVMFCGGQVCQVDVEFIYVGMEGFFCCLMIVYCYFLCFVYIGQFIICFIGVVVMQIVDNIFWVDVVGGDI